jgi:hypothetical protein
MITSDNGSGFVQGGEPADGGLDTEGHLPWITDVGFQRGRGVDTQFGDVDSQFQVIVFEGCGRGDDGRWAIAGAAAERRGAVDGDWDDYGGC